ncbi:hypothetical protein Kkor_0749 [Kangiella koreensis DSM 16069]|uniref:Uncharacterized protein n=1 Tax=Kangiella koreensis (strain DSM 16069 / JCM 12317 / KCTC 12182 / SW-125) TaxID=523791 RepID=C7RA50_KANKD|nr:hypothetical protein Kkor_0749 [Kangiella koreensis DSM 16069]
MKESSFTGSKQKSRSQTPAFLYRLEVGIFIELPLAQIL